MFAFRRSFRGTEWQTKFLDFKYNKNHPTNSFLGLFSSQSTLSTLGIGGGGRNVLQQPTSCLQNSSSMSPFYFKCPFVAAETRFSLHQGLTSYNNDPSHLSSFGVNLHRRCVSTVGRPDDAVDQGSSNVPGDTLLPERIKVKRLDKTAKHIMNILDKEALDKVRSEGNIPDIKAGYIVEIKVEAPENKGRISIVKGLVIAKRNSGIATTIRVRRLESSVGTESVLPLYSPNIKDIKVLEKRSARRAKLYYIRERPYNVALRELAQRTAKKKEMVLRAKRAEQSKKK